MLAKCISVLLGFSFLIQQSQACNPYQTIGSPHYDPLIFLDYELFSAPGSGLSKEIYLDAIEKVKKIYEPIVNAKGGTLDFPEHHWSNNSVNGTVNRYSDGRWTVDVYGGYARHKLATVDSLLFILCHELGHHLGETHYYSGSYFWASGEGQADYFSTTKCMRNVLENEDNEAYLKEVSYPDFLKSQCESQFANYKDQLICIRSALAGYGMTKVWVNGNVNFSFDTPTQTKASATYTYHPEHQCRIDTYLQGALCEVPASVENIPGDYRVGNCNISTGHEVGLRPGCWFNENDFTNKRKSNSFLM